MRSALFISVWLAGCGLGHNGVDRDGDGYTEQIDCNDTNASVNPGASETCDAVDNDCDGVIDNGVTGTWYPDDDQDGFGDIARAVEACSPPEGLMETGGDCDDDNDEIHPLATEICDGIDDDCDGQVDNGAQSTWHYDGDGDGFGSPTVTEEACERPEGYVDNAQDCHDGRPDVNPDAVEVCDGLDQDCDGIADNGVLQTWYLDGDFDGYGQAGLGVEACEPPSGYVGNDDDCDDTTAGVHPGVEADACDGVDSDCDGDVDEDAKSNWHLVTVHDPDEVVYEIDPSTASVSTLSSLDILNQTIPTMDVREDGLAVVYDARNNELLEIDACRGTLSSIGSTETDVTCGISFGPGGQLFGIDRDNDVLVTFDLATGEATTVGDLGFDIQNCGLAYDCQNDRLMGAENVTNTLFEIDTVSGAAHSFLSTTVPYSAVGLEFNPTNGKFFASTGEYLYELDSSTGASTLIGGYPSGYSSKINDLALYPECAS